MRTIDEIKCDIERQQTFSQRLQTELELATKNVNATLGKIELEKI